MQCNAFEDFSMRPMANPMCRETVLMGLNGKPRIIKIDTICTTRWAD